MNCCLMANDIPSCVTGDITIGTITDLNTNVIVKITCIATGNITNESVTSDGSGNVVMTGFEFPSRMRVEILNESYEPYVINGEQCCVEFGVYNGSHSGALSLTYTTCGT